MTYFRYFSPNHFCNCVHIKSIRISIVLSYLWPDRGSIISSTTAVASLLTITSLVRSYLDKVGFLCTITKYINPYNMVYIHQYPRPQSKLVQEIFWNLSSVLLMHLYKRHFLKDAIFWIHTFNGSCIKSFVWNEIQNCA